MTARLFGVFPGSYPPPHAKYILRRCGFVYTVTPCYCMHSPWWVVKTLTGEEKPVPMVEGDEWEALE